MNVDCPAPARSTPTPDVPHQSLPRNQLVPSCNKVLQKRELQRLHHDRTAVHAHKRITNVRGKTRASILTDWNLWRIASETAAYQRRLNSRPNRRYSRPIGVLIGAGRQGRDFSSAIDALERDNDDGHLRHLWSSPQDVAEFLGRDDW
jgi:hypothetical protein